ncbi:hypothetical protein [Rhodoglobus sp.]
MNASDNWYQEVATLSGESSEVAREILEQERIPAQRVLPARRRLRVEAVHFSGVKNLAHPDGEDERVREAFSFTHELTHTITAFLTRARNDAGKSTVLDVILWAVRGTSGLAGDVRAWMRQASVQFSIDGTSYVVWWRMDEKVPSGQIVTLRGSQNLDWQRVNDEALREAEDEVSAGEIPAERPMTRVIGEAINAGAFVAGVFVDDESFKRTIANLMSSALGFEETEAWAKHSNASETSDGHLVTHGWPLWSQALAISDKPIKVTIGDEAQASQLVLQMYLGTAWGPAALAAKARRLAIESQIASLKRRQSNDERDRDETVAALQSELAELEAEQETLSWVDELDKLEELVSGVRGTAQELAKAESDYLVAARLYGQFERDLADAQADEVALEEAAVTKRFWHSLKPSCCPRCDAVVDEKRWKKERDGQCSLCDSDISEIAEPAPVEFSNAEAYADESDDMTDDRSAIRERIVAVTEARETASDVLDAATDERERAAGAHRVATEAIGTSDIDVARPRRIEMEIATLRGRIEERSRVSVAPAELTEREQVVSVLKAAEQVAKVRSDKERTELLSLVSTDITELGQALGFAQLESAKFQANCNLPVVKGGERVNFGSLTEGERLRLKVAVIIALLRVGTGAGVGRHPGLLVIDSLAREELNPADAKQLLEELEKVADLVGLQIITASARGEMIAEALPPDAVRFARESDDYMW